MTEYIDELTNYSFSTFGQQVSSASGSDTDERALIDFHRSLDLPEAIASQVNSVVSETEFGIENHQSRVWGLVVIELYLHLIAGMSEADRYAARQYVDAGEAEYRLARMCMLIWLHPAEAPRIAWALAETPAIWLRLHGYPNESTLKSKIAERLGEFAVELRDLHLRMKDHVQSLQEKCLYDLCTIP
jgi:hypothetical protein